MAQTTCINGILHIIIYKISRTASRTGIIVVKLLKKSVEWLQSDHFALLVLTVLLMASPEAVDLSHLLVRAAVQQWVTQIEHLLVTSSEFCASSLQSVEI